MSDEAITFKSLAEAEEAFATAQGEHAELIKAQDDKVSELQGQVAEGADTIASLQTQLDESNAALDEHVAEISALQEEAEKNEAELAELRAKDMDADRRAASIAAAAGSENPVEGPIGGNGDTYFERYQSLSGSAKVEFWRTHEADILAGR